MKAIYIAGFGRSGSTLLARLLSRRPGFVAVGELERLWESGVHRQSATNLCSCGLSFTACGFWRRVCATAFRNPPPGDIEDIPALKRSVDRTRYIPWLRFAWLRPRAFDQRLRRYRAVLRDLYTAIDAVSGGAVIVDSSKHASSLLALAGIEGLSITIVHLVRDPRGVAHSWGKQIERLDVTDRRILMARKTAAASATNWSYANVAVHLAQAAGAAYLLVRYEDLVRDPTGVLERIYAADASNEPESRPDPSEPAGAHHIINANGSKFAKAPLELRLDTAWQQDMQARHRWLVTAISAPLLWRYGYARR